MKKRILMFLLSIISILSIINSQGLAMADKPSDYYKMKLKEVNVSDGVNKEEAILIAQNALIEEGIGDDYRISAPIAIESSLVKGCWFVKFNEKIKFGHTLERIFLTLVGGGPHPPWYGFHIDKKTGEIKKKDYWYPDL